MIRIYFLHVSLSPKHTFSFHRPHKHKTKIWQKIYFHFHQVKWFKTVVQQQQNIILFYISFYILVSAMNCINLLWWKYSVLSWWQHDNNQMGQNKRTYTVIKWEKYFVYFIFHFLIWFFFYLETLESHFSSTKWKDARDGRQQSKHKIVAMSRLQLAAFFGFSFGQQNVQNP